MKNQNTFFIILFAVISLITFSCNNNVQKDNVSSDNNITKENSENTFSTKEKTIRKKVQFSGSFYSITNIGTPNIVFTPGPYNIEVEAPEKKIENAKISIDSGVLLIGETGGNKQGAQLFCTDSITYYISCPKLNILAVCGKGNFYAQNVEADDMQVGVMGEGSINIDTIHCNSLRYEINKPIETKLGKVFVAENCSILTNADGIFKADVDVKGILLVDDMYNSDIEITGKTNKLEASLFGKGTFKYNGTFKTKDIGQGKNAKVFINN